MKEIKNFKNVLKGTILTEKSSKLMEANKKFVFEVSTDSTKGQMKNIIETLFSVKVADINMLKTRGREKRNTLRNKRNKYRSKDTKKAIVTLKSGTIDLFEEKKADKKSKMASLPR